MSSHVLEAVNGAWFVLASCLLAIFLRYIAFELRRSLAPWRVVWRRDDLFAAGALAIYFLGESIVRGWTWWWRHQINNGVDVTWMRDYPLLPFGATVAIVGGLFLVRAFTPAGCGHRAWLLTGAAAAIVAGLLVS